MPCLSLSSHRTSVTLMLSEPPADVAATYQVDLDQDAIEVDDTGRQGFLSRLDPTKARTSTKIEALLEELSKTRSEDRTLKTLVFSQFTTMLFVSSFSLSHIHADLVFCHAVTSLLVAFSSAVSSSFELLVR